MTDLTESERENLLSLLITEWHDRTCPEGDECRDRDIHALSVLGVMPVIHDLRDAVTVWAESIVAAREDALRENIATQIEALADEWEREGLTLIRFYGAACEACGTQYQAFGSNAVSQLRAHAARIVRGTS